MHSGYRVPHKSWSYYLASLFQIHNETGNVWSHLIALVLFVYKTLHVSTQVEIEHDSLYWGFMGFSFGAIGYASLSVFAHLFQSKSELLHYTCFQIDYIGIGLNGFGCACLLHYMTGTESYYESAPSCFLIFNMLFAVMVCVCCSVAKLKYRRPYPLQRKFWQMGSVGIHVVLGSLPLFWMYYECVFDNNCTFGKLLPHLQYTFWFLTSAFFFASCLPERLAPGMFDILGHGHQLFHIFMTITTLIQYDVALEALRSRSANLIDMAGPNASSITLSIIGVLLLDVAFIVYTHKYRVAKVQNDLIYDKTMAKDL